MACVSGGQLVVTQLALASPGPPGQPDIMTTRSMPMRLASLMTLRVTASCRLPCSRGWGGLPEHLSALTAMPCSATLAANSRRAAALSSIASSLRCGAEDQLPPANSSISMPSRAAVRSSSSNESWPRLSLIMPIFMLFSFAASQLGPRGRVAEIIETHPRIGQRMSDRRILLGLDDEPAGILGLPQCLEQRRIPEGAIARHGEDTGDDGIEEARIGRPPAVQERA